MSLPFNGLGSSNYHAPTDTVSSLEPVKLDERKEVHVGSLGLGTALAVAYDLYSDSNQMASHHIYSPQLGGFISLSAVKSSGAQVPQHLASYVRTATGSAEPQYAMYPAQNNYHSSYPPNTLWAAHQADSYLTPIVVSSSTTASTPSCPTRPFAVVSDNGKFRLTATPLHKQPDGSNVVYVDSNAPSSVSTASIVVDGGAITTSSATLPFDPTQVASSTSTHVPTIPTPSTCSAFPCMVSVPNHQDGLTSQYHHPSNSTAIATNSVEQVAAPTKSGGESNSISADDSLYEISEEEMREIDASLANNPDVMASRQWKYYTETNEWTRATCALMACLFTRDQMANSTVLGRGGSQRARLPSNLVAYVVGTIRKRFNKPAAAVRARMAQKCKDERRFGRLTVTGSGTVYSVDGQDHNGGSGLVAAVTGKSAIVGTGGGSSRKARKRSAANLNSSQSVRLTKSSNCSTPPSEFASTPGYQPTAYNDDACSSTTDSNQLPPLALSPSMDPDHELYLRSSDDCLHLPTVSIPQSSGHTLSMMLMVPGMDTIQPSSTGDTTILSANHLPPPELAS
ncbi:hypothetical protein CSKR_110621 [Clonorchis sinensis]|uniref:Uncharacterized protein n=2 Tax=Clonorchis sinensis TaxID=79923 RepID=G7YJ00_CLOSI|nr:hypothetical protein CSKR_110621 [Clonorchis sinensis]GAA52933.1 hypothetical protein CLF_109143 [Clonorchis sinensis]